MGLKSFFASPERTTSSRLQQELTTVNDSPLVDGLMKAVQGLVAILDKNRQIISLNETLINLLGIEDAQQALGLRLGEAIKCIHSGKMEAGCGTSRHCASCGAAIAMVACIEEGAPHADRICAASVQRQGQQQEMCLRVHCAPLDVDNERFYLLFLQDITQQQAWAAMERVFFHDLNNLLSAIVGTNELLMLDKSDQQLIERLGQLIPRLANEIELQRCLTQAKTSGYQTAIQSHSINGLLAELEATFANHPASRGRYLHVETLTDDRLLHTDCTLLMRVLTNMVTNALEASPPGETVKVWLTTQADQAIFHVWNLQYIPEKEQLRIFQRHFSTKEGQGRGLGTYSMKLFGEKFLGGQVDFSSHPHDGTTFRLTLALNDEAKP